MNLAQRISTLPYFKEGVVRTPENGYWVSSAIHYSAWRGEGGNYVVAYPS